MPPGFYCSQSQQNQMQTERKGHTRRGIYSVMMMITNGWKVLSQRAGLEEELCRRRKDNCYKWMREIKKKFKREIRTRILELVVLCFHSVI